jgi:hypothetical protein
MTPIPPSSPTSSTFSSASSTSQSAPKAHTRRPSRFVEGEATTMAAGPNAGALYFSIMAEMDDYEAKHSQSSHLQSERTEPRVEDSTMTLGRRFGTRHRRGGSASSASSNGSTSSTGSVSQSSIRLSFDGNRDDTRSLSTSGVSEKIKGRLRALTTGTRGRV